MISVKLTLDVIYEVSEMTSIIHIHQRDTARC